MPGEVLSSSGAAAEEGGLQVSFDLLCLHGQR